MTTDSRKVQLETGVDPTGAQQGFQQVKDSARDMAAGVAQSAQTAAKAVDSVGSGAAGTSGKITSAERSIIASIQRMTAAFQAGGKSGSEYFSTIADQRGLRAEVFAPYLQALDQAKQKSDAAAQAAQQLAAANKLVADLQFKVDSFGKTTTDLLALKAAEVGATQAAAPLIAQLKALETQATATAAAERQAAQGANFVQGLQAQAAAIGKTTSELLELKAAQLGVSAQAQPFIDKLRAAEQGTGKLGVSAGQTAAAFRQLPAQLTDVATQLAGGQSPFLILLQQGGQIKDSFGGLGATFKALASAITPTTVAVVAAAAAVGALAYGVSQVEKQAQQLATFNAQLAGTGRASLVSSDQLQAYVKQLSLLPGVTKDAATAIVNEFTKAHGIGASMFGDLVSLSADFARATGTDAPAAAKKLAEAFSDPAKGAKDLDSALGTLSASQIKHIEDLTRQNDLLGAQRALYDALAPSIQGLANGAVTPLGSALNDLARAWNEAVSNFGNTQGLKIANDGLVLVINKIIEGINYLEQFGKKWADLPTRGLNGMVLRGLGLGDTPGGATGGWTPEPQTGGATGDFGGAGAAGALGAQARALLDANKAAANATSSYKAFSERQKDLTEDAKRLTAQITATNLAVKQGIIPPDQGRDEASLLRERLAGVNEAISKARPPNQGQAEVAQIQATTEARQQELAILQQYGAEAVKLTDGEKLVIKIQEELKTSLSGVARAQKEKALAAAQDQATVDKQIQAQQRVIKSQQDLAKAAEGVGNDADQIRQKAAAQEAANASLGKSQVAMEQAALAQMQLSAAQLDATEHSDPAYLAALQQKIAAQQQYVQTLKDAQYAAYDKQLTEQARVNQETSNTLQLEVSLLGATQEQRAVILAQRQAEVALAKEKAAIDRGDYSDEKKAELKARATEISQVTAANNATRKILDIQERAADQINQSLTDALLRGFESGKDFATNFRDTLKNMFATLVLKPVIQWVLSPVTGAIAGITTSLLGGTSGAGQSGGTNLLSLASSGSTLAKLAGSASTFGSGFSAGLGAVFGESGTAGGLSAGFTALGAGNTAGGLGTLAGVAAPYLAAAAALYAAFKPGERVNTNSGYTLGAQGTDLGTQNFDISKVVGGGFLTGGDKERTNYSATPDAQAQILRTMYANSNAALSSGLAAIGVDFSSKITGFVEQAFNVGLGGLSVDQQAQVLAKYFSDVQEREAQYVLGDGAGGFGKAGETAVQTINRLATALQGVNPVLAALGQNALSVSLAGADAASKLSDLFGSLDNLKSAAGSYLQNYYTQGQRDDLTRSQVAQQLSTVGLSLPATRDAFRSLVEAQDLTTDSGRRAYAALLQVNEAFASFTPTAEDAAAAIRKNLTGAVQDAYDALSRSIDAQKTAIDNQYNAAHDAITQTISNLTDGVSHLRSLSDSLKSTLAGMSLGTIASDIQDRQSAQEQIRAALGLAQAGGAADINQEALSNALQIVEKPAQAQFASFTDYAKDFAKTSGDIADLSKYTDGSLTAEQQLLAQAQKQSDALDLQHTQDIARLDDILAQAKAQVDAINGVDDSVKALGTAIQAFNGASKAAGGGQVVDKGVGTTQGDGSIVYDNGGLQNAGGYYSSARDVAATQQAAANSAAITAAYEQYLGRAPDLAGQIYNEQQLAAGASVQDLIDAIKNSIEAQGKVDGSHAGGLSYVPFDGYRAELHRGERVLTESQNREYSAPRAYTAAGTAQTDAAELTRAFIAYCQRNDKRADDMAKDLRQLADDIHRVATQRGLLTTDAP